MTDASLGIIRDGAIASVGESIAWVGREGDLPGEMRRSAAEVVSCGGAWMTPGFIDCHTHIVFGGDRSGDFRRRLRGESYARIARSGGGIMSTVRATRAASREELTRCAVARARELTDWGVTTIEVKSGYGLDLETELRMLDVAATLPRHIPADISPTLLAAHAIPHEYAGRRRAYLRLIVGGGHPRGAGARPCKSDRCLLRGHRVHARGGANRPRCRHLRRAARPPSRRPAVGPGRWRPRRRGRRPIGRPPRVSVQGRGAGHGFGRGVRSPSFQERPTPWVRTAGRP